MGLGVSSGIPTNFGLSVAQGAIPNTSGIVVFGRNPTINTNNTPQDVWGQGGLWVAPTQARIHNIASSSASDTSAGTGARTITISGLDANYNQQTENVTMNGTSNVPTVNSYIFISHMLVLTAGSGAKNAGNITATAQVDGTVTNSILAGYNNDILAVYQIPNGYTGYLNSWQAGMTQNVASSSADAQLLIMPFGGVFAIYGFHTLSNSGTSNETDAYSVPQKLSAKTIIKINVSSVSNNSTSVQGIMDITLVKN